MKFKIAEPKASTEPTITFSLELSDNKDTLILMGEVDGHETMILSIGIETGSIHRAYIKNTMVGNLLKQNKNGFIFDANLQS